MSCPDCTAAATNPTWGGYHADCRGCEIRAAAVAPQHARTAHYCHIFEHEGAAGLAEFKARVKAEYERIQALKGKA